VVGETKETGQDWCASSHLREFFIAFGNVNLIKEVITERGVYEKMRSTISLIFCYFSTISYLKKLPGLKTQTCFIPYASVKISAFEVNLD